MGTEHRCAALAIAIVRGAVETPIIYNTKNAKTRPGLGTYLKKVKNDPKRLLFWNYCPYCGGVL